MLLISNNEIIKNGIIDVDRVFINTDDAIPAFKCTYNEANRNYYNVLPAGDIIGKLANATANIQENLKEIMHRYNGELYTKNEMFNILKPKENMYEANTDDDEEMEAEKKLRDEVYQEIRKYEIPDEEQKQIQLEKFFEAQEHLFKLTVLSMKGIDQPKTCRTVEKEEVELLAPKGKVNRMFYKLPEKDYKLASISNNNTPLSAMSIYVGNTLWESKYRYANLKDVDVWKNLFSGMVNPEINVECLSEVNEIFNRFVKDYKHMVEFNIYKDVKDIVYMSAEVDCKAIQERYELYDVVTVLNEIIGTRKDITRFILDNFYDVIIKCLDNKYEYFTEMYADEAGVVGMFGTYSYKENYNLDFRKYYRKEKFRINVKLGMNVEIGTALGELDSEVVVRLEADGIFFVNSNGIKIKVYHDGLKKNNIILNEGDIVKIGAITQRFEKSQKVIIKEIN